MGGWLRGVYFSLASAEWIREGVCGKVCVFTNGVYCIGPILTTSG